MLGQILLVLQQHHPEGAFSLGPLNDVNDFELGVVFADRPSRDRPVAPPSKPGRLSLSTLKSPPHHAPHTIAPLAPADSCLLACFSHVGRR